MLANNRPVSLRFEGSRVASNFKNAGSFRVVGLLILIGFLAATFYSSSSASSGSRFSSLVGGRLGIGDATAPSNLANQFGISLINGSYFGKKLRAPAALSGSESIIVSPPAVRNAGCTNPAVLCLGETVTAVVSNAPLRAGFRERRIIWVAPDGTVPQVVDVTTDPQTDTYTLPTTGSFAQVGTWSVRTINNRGGGVAVTNFEVGDPTQPSTDLAISVTGPTSVTANTNVSYSVTVTNNGPDSADNVTLFNPVPYNTTFVSASVPGDFSCTTPASGAVGDISCTSASLALNASAAFTFVFSVNSDVTNGTSVYEWAKTGTSTNEPDKSNNISDIYASSTSTSGGGGTCTLDCPEDINTIANTTESSVRGAHVTYDPPNPTGDCGTVTSTPASGSFFPVGTTTVTSTSDQNGGSCSFTVTVEDQGTNPPTISCPLNPPAANADSNCEATITIGNPTVAGNNVTFSGVRSDGKPMYNCDCFPNSPNQQDDACNIHGACTRRADAPFSSGITTITWTAYSHDIPGPYTTPEDEEAHRTGNASCTETVTVNDVTPPTIIAANQTASADANCQAPVPDFSTIAIVSDNCACASSDTSQICDSRQDITITQDVAPGTLVGLGPHTIHLTANDGSSNNGGAGNSTTISVTFTVNDTTPPTFTFVPPAVTAFTGAGATSCDTVVSDATLGTATASDNCSAVTITRSPSGNTFPVGTTTVVWTAKDVANNAATANQTVTVIDNTPPVISCPSSIVLEPTCPSGAIATYTAPVGTDNCPGVTTTRTAGGASGTVFPIGTTTVTYTANDAHDNSTSCSFTVTVLTPQAVIQNLINSISASSLTGTQKNGLLAKLNAALDGLNSGHTSVACNKLSDFINSVQNLVSHGDITSAQGQAWINSANHVQNTIGCTNNPCT